MSHELKLRNISLRLRNPQIQTSPSEIGLCYPAGPPETEFTLPAISQCALAMLFSKPQASNPAKLKLSKDLWRKIEPEQFSWKQVIKDYFLVSSGKHSAYTGISEALEIGDGDAGWVVSTNPPIVAAFSGELDVVVLLRMNKAWPRVAKWKRGQRILVVNVYPLDGFADPRLIPGNPQSQFRNFFPLVPELICDDLNRIGLVASRVPEAVWQRALEHAKVAVQVESPYIRDGRPSSALTGS